MPSLFMDFFKQEKQKEEFDLLKDTRKSKVKFASEHQTGKSNLKIDKRRKALPPGKRVSKSGNVYYEYRKNRSDKKSKSI